MFNASLISIPGNWKLVIVMEIFLIKKNIKVLKTSFIWKN